MRKIHFMLLILLALSACGKEDVQEHHNQPGQEMQLHISAQLMSEAPKAMDYKLIRDKVQQDLASKSQIPVHTYIYEGNRMLYAKRLTWDVTDEKKIKYNGAINLTVRPNNPSQLRLIAVVGDVIGSPESDDITLASSYSEGGEIQLLSANKATTVNVPYIMESKLKQDASGIWIPKDEAQTFKPYGHLVRFKMENITACEVMITGVSSNGFLAGKSTLNVATKTLHREEYGTHLDLRLSKGVKIASGATSTESFILWVPEMGADDSYSLDLRAKGLDDSYIYTLMNVKKSQGDYQAGKIYNAKLTLRRTCIPNPLSLLSEDVMMNCGKDFVNLRNTFVLDDLNTYNGPGKVGYFRHCEAIKRFCWERPYPSTKCILWHLPDFFEWNSILYDPRNTKGSMSYQDRTDKVRVKVGVGRHSSERGHYSYWKTISYSVHVPEDAKGTYQTEDTHETRPTIRTGKSFYVLSFAKADAQLPDDKCGHRFPRETEDVNRYAFRYTVYEDHIRIDCAPVGVQDIQVAQLPGHRIFSGISVVSRKIPFYGISNRHPFVRKDNTGGNRRIIDYATNTRNEHGTPVIAAFSAPGNAIMPYSKDIGFPVALFRKW